MTGRRPPNSHKGDARGLDDAGLCELLDCTPEQLRTLKMCKTPRPETNDVATIAGHAGVDVGKFQALLAWQG